MTDIVRAEHLGGFIPGGDPDTVYPEMWQWLIDTWEVKSVIDIGCGEGTALSYFREHGCNVLGVEGVEQPDADIYQFDFTTCPFDPEQEFPGRTFEYDLAWSAEFVEHVDEAYIPNFMPCFRAARFALITHGEPGQPGWHHVNNQPAEYWRGVFAGAGFEFDAGLTAMTRAASSANTRTFNHYRRSGLAFRRRG